jgi:ABC-type xylose transport system permease subunit
MGFIWGVLTAEATRRASGGHREWSVGIVAVGAILLGGLAGWFLGGVSAFTVIVAIVVALADLALLQWR